VAILKIRVRLFQLQFLDPYVAIQYRMPFCLQLDASRGVGDPFSPIIATVYP